MQVSCSIRGHHRVRFGRDLPVGTHHGRRGRCTAAGLALRASGGHRPPSGRVLRGAQRRGACNCTILIRLTSEHGSGVVVHSCCRLIDYDGCHVRRGDGLTAPVTLVASCLCFWTLVQSLGSGFWGVARGFTNCREALCFLRPVLLGDTVVHALLSDFLPLRCTIALPAAVRVLRSRLMIVLWSGHVGDLWNVRRIRLGWRPL